MKIYKAVGVVMLLRPIELRIANGKSVHGKEAVTSRNTVTAAKRSLTKPNAFAMMHSRGGAAW